MVVSKENGCRICRKIFCCSDCRDTHETSKHPGSKCSLCVKQDLPYKAFLTKDLRKHSDFFCHIVFNHLPLRCKLCGDKFTNNQDLLTAKTCRWWNEEFRLKQRESQQPSVVISDVSCTVENDSADLEVNAKKDLPLTPVFLSSGDDSKSLQIADNSSIIRLKQENFDSPPELVRNTSTPMHGIGVLGQKQLGTAAIPQFVLKTPSSFDKHTFETTGSACSHVSSSEFESRYYTGTGSNVNEPLVTLSLSNNNNTNNTSENQPEVDPSWNSPSCPVLKNQLPPKSVEIGKDKKERVERSIMKQEVLDRVSRTSDSSRDSIGKKVRFSDQCSDHPRLTPSSTNCSVQETPADSSVASADSEIFFEAQQSLVDEDDSGPCDGNEPVPCFRGIDEELKEREILVVSTVATNNDNNNFTDNNSISNTDEKIICNTDNKTVEDKIHKNISGESNSSTSNNNNDKNNNDDSSSNNNSKKKNIESIVDSSVEDNKSTTSSRVLMMLVVEKTDSNGLSNLDLRPLINSELKKLEKRVSSVNSSSYSDKGCHECSCKSSKFSTEVSSFTRKINNPFAEDKGVKIRCGANLRAPINDSFVSLGEKGEYYQGATVLSKQSKEVIEEHHHQQQQQQQQQQQHQQQQHHHHQRQVSKKADSYVSSCMSDGIFSVVARVVRCALKKLPAVGSITSRNLSREPLPQTACSPVRITTTSSYSITSTEELSLGSSCNSSASTSRIVLQRSASKRPHDRLDYTEEFRHVPLRDYSGNVSPRGDLILGPAAKRHRGWYRIRAREPIARMRKRTIVSPRGASLETQRFQQGSLTVGDTHLPLPSRAHQSTQTE